MKELNINDASPTNADAAIATLQTLLSIASGVTAVIGGVTTPVVGGMAVIQALMPIVSQFIVTIGDKNIVMDVSSVTTADVVATMEKDIETGFPILSFK